MVNYSDSEYVLLRKSAHKMISRRRSHCHAFITAKHHSAVNSHRRTQVNKVASYWSRITRLHDVLPAHPKEHPRFLLILVSDRTVGTWNCRQPARADAPQSEFGPFFLIRPLKICPYRFINVPGLSSGQCINSFLFSPVSNIWSRCWRNFWRRRRSWTWCWRYSRSRR